MTGTERVEVSRECATPGACDGCNGNVRFAWPGGSSKALPVECRCKHHTDGYDHRSTPFPAGTYVTHSWWKGADEVRARVIETKTDVLLARWDNGDIAWHRIAALRAVSV